MTESEEGVVAPIWGPTMQLSSEVWGVGGMLGGREGR